MRRVVIDVLPEHLHADAVRLWHDIPTLQLMVRAGNEPVLAFYDRLGHEPSDVHVLARRLG